MGGNSDGIKPDEQIFDEGCMIEIAEILGVGQRSNQLPNLQDALIKIGLQRRAEIRVTPMKYPGLAPFAATLNQRKNWLDRNAVKPAEKLLKALHENNAPYFSVWPDEATLKEIPDLQRLAELLTEFHAFSDRLHGCIEDLYETTGEKPEHTLEMSRAITFDVMAALCRFFPTVEIVRNPEGKKRKNEGSSTAQKFLRRAFFEVTGKHAQLTKELQLFIADFVNFRTTK